MRSIVYWIAALFLMLFNGCSDVQGMLTFETDPLLPRVNEVKTIATMSSVGFEWKKIDDPRVTAFNVYRGYPGAGQRSLKQIATVGSRYATHFVDTRLKPDTEYLYSITTVALGRESLPGKPIRVKTAKAFEPVSFLKAYKVSPETVKLLWAPHAHPAVASYVIERRDNGGKWHFLAEVKGRLMPEYIDTFVSRGNAYAYRIRAKSFDGVLATPSPVSELAL